MPTAWVIAGVLLVHPTQPGAFHDIQSACNAAAERDTILVETGAYGPFEVIGKWLTVASDAGATVDVAGGARVRGLASSQRVNLIGLRLTGTHAALPATAHGLELTSNVGAVRVTGCTLSGADTGGQPASPDGGDGVRVDTSPDVAITRSQLLGGRGSTGYRSYVTGRAGAGLRAIASGVTLYDCSVSGGVGDSAVPCACGPVDGGIGGDGCFAQSSGLFLSNSVFAGGAGGDGGMSLPLGSFGGDGGDGIFLSSSLARRVSVTSAGGSGGMGSSPFPPFPGTPGLPAAGSQFIDLGPIGRSMSVSTNPIRELQSELLTLSGHPGDRVGFFVSFFTSSTFNEGWNGQQLFPNSPFPMFIDAGVVPGSGVVTYPLPFSDLGPGVAARTVMIQPVFSSSTVRLVLGTPIPLLVLDSAY